MQRGSAHISYLLEHVPEHLKTQEMCDKAVWEDLSSLQYVPDHLQTQEMCDDAVREGSCELDFFLDHFKMQEMCNEAVPIYLYLLEHVPEQLK